MGARFIDKSPEFIMRSDMALDMAVGMMAADIERLAKMQAPAKSGYMRSKIVHTREGLKHFVVTDNVKYARFQEYGVRSDGSHRVREWTTPGTKDSFMRDSGKKVAALAAGYFKTALTASGL